MAATRDRSGHLEFVHSETGIRTLKAEFDKVASHNEHHLAQIGAEWFVAFSPRRVDREELKTPAA
jgi:hypothetical protein